MIQLLFDRNEQGIQEMDLRYGPALFRLSNGILRCPEDAQEQVSETYLRAWNTIPPQWPRKLYAYLAKICRNLSLNAWERKNAAKRNPEVLSLTLELAQCIPDRLQTRRMETKELGIILADFLKGLSPDNRALFLRRYWYGDTIPELAQRYRKGENAVTVQLHRLRRQLAQHLEKEGYSL